MRGGFQTGSRNQSPTLPRQSPSLLVYYDSNAHGECVKDDFHRNKRVWSEWLRGAAVEWVLAVEEFYWKVDVVFNRRVKTPSLGFEGRVKKSTLYTAVVRRAAHPWEWIRLRLKVPRRYRRYRIGCKTRGSSKLALMTTRSPTML